MNAPASLYDWAPTAHVALAGLVLAAAPLSWIWARHRGASLSARLAALCVLTLFLTFDLVMFGAFTRLTDALVAQYNGHCPLDDGKTCVNGRLTLGENIGDLGGLSLAYRAYHLSLKGKKAPVIITRDMVGRMKYGAIIVDMAAESGGNCELTQAGEHVIANEKALAKASKKLDKAVSKGVIHENQAANRKSSIAKQVAAL